MPNVPKPLHGLNPRSIMGKEQWDKLRQEVYASTNYHCAACGVHKSRAKKHQWLEAHETYEIDYPKGLATLTEIVPLCHFCHNFIHSGRLRALARKREVTAEHVRNVMRHGVAVLKEGPAPIFRGTKELCDLVSVSTSQLRILPAPRDIAPWGRWRMSWDGTEYRGKFRSMKQWERQFA
jgi:hypothetical protein